MNHVQAFGSFGGLYALTSCIAKRLRNKDDCKALTLLKPSQSDPILSQVADGIDFVIVQISVSTKYRRIEKGQVNGMTPVRTRVC